MFVLFTSIKGYAAVYLIAGVLYVIGALFLLVAFKKKYNNLTRPASRQATTQEVGETVVAEQVISIDD